MKLRTEVRDSLFLTWALPEGCLPAPPRPLRYEIRTADGKPYVFASVVLSRQHGLRVPVLPIFSLSYPQFHLFLYVLDGDDRPAVYLQQVLVPVWLGAGMRLVTGLPVGAASFDVPNPSENPEQETWHWRVRAEGELAVTARRGAPRIGEGPRFPSWEAMVRSLRDRATTYTQTGDGLRRLELTVNPGTSPWPLVAVAEETTLLSRLLPLAKTTPWPPLYAAWLDPELPIVLALAPERKVAMASGVPAPG